MVGRKIGRLLHTSKSGYQSAVEGDHHVEFSTMIWTLARVEPDQKHFRMTANSTLAR